MNGTQTLSKITQELNKYQKYAAYIKDLTSQIDRDKLTIAIKAVGELGNGTQMTYTQDIEQPYHTEIYVTVKLYKDMWKMIVFRYGGLYFKELEEAMNLVADEVLGKVKWT